MAKLCPGNEWNPDLQTSKENEKISSKKRVLWLKESEVKLQFSAKHIYLWSVILKNS